MNFSFDFVFKHYFKHLFDGFHQTDVIIGVIYILISVMVGLWKGWKQTFRLLIIGYFLFVLYATVISRPQKERIQYCLIPFNSYFFIEDGDRFLLPQVLMNIVMFIPIGFLLKVAYSSWELKKVLAYGSLFSLLIEMLQLALMKGVAEVDDLIHNTFGCVIGYGMAVLLSALRFKYKVVLGR
jgi:glycopeptide antibiotics resistance protein